MVAVVASVFLFLALAAGSVLLFAPARFGRKTLERRIRALRPAGSSDDTRRSDAPTFRRSRSSIPTLRRFLEDNPWAEAAALELQQANIHLRVGEYLLIRLLLAMLFLIIPVLLLRAHPIGLVVAVVAGATGYMGPAMFLKSVRRRRIARIEKQLIEFLPALGSSLRSGFAFQQGIEVAAKEFGPPLANELALLLNDVSLGATMQAALQDLGRRVGSTDLDMVITAVLVQRTTGGNLSEVLDRAAETLRERERIRGDVQTFTAQQRLTGTILSAYPIAIGLLLLAIMPSMWSKLLTESVGQILLAIAVALQLLGFFAVRRILDIDI